MLLVVTTEVNDIILSLILVLALYGRSGYCVYV